MTAVPDFWFERADENPGMALSSSERARLKARARWNQSCFCGGRGRTSRVETRQSRTASSGSTFVDADDLGLSVVHAQLLADGIFAWIELSRELMADDDPARRVRGVARIEGPAAEDRNGDGREIGPSMTRCSASRPLFSGRSARPANQL
jgi:hypothetical protein